MVEERRVEAQPQILIVENDNQTIEVLRQALRNQGYATVTATSSVAALEKLQASVRAGDPIDLILWGAMVSDTDGGVELKELRTNEALSDIPVLMLIEKQALKDRLTALDRAVSDYLAKPFDSQELIGRIRTLLRHKAKERWLQNRNNALIALHELILQIYSIQNLDAMLRLIVEKATHLVGAKRSLILLIDEKMEGELKAYGHNYPPEHLEGFTIEEFQAGLSGWVLHHGEPAITNSAKEDSRQSGIAAKKAKQFGSGPLMVAPIIIDDKVGGTLTVIKPIGGTEFTKDDLNLIVMLATQVAAALTSTRFFQQLDEAQERLSGLVRSSFDAIVAIDKVGKITVFNKRAEELFGYREEQILGKSVERLHTDINNARRINSLVRDKGSIFNYEVPLRNKHGQEIKALLSAVQLIDDQGKDHGQAGFIRDQQDMLLLENRQRALIEASQTINSALETEQVLELVMNSVLHAFPSAHRGALHLYNDSTGLLELVVNTHPHSQSAIKSLHFKSGEGIAGWIYEHDQAVVIQDAENDTRYKKIDHPEAHRHRSMICAPLRARGSVIGTISLANGEDSNAFKNDDIDLLSSFADQVGLALDRSQQFEQVQKQIKDIELLQKISAEISAKIKIDHVLEALAEGGRELLGVEMATAHMVDEATGGFRTYIAPKGKEKLSQRPRRRGGLTDLIIQSGKPIIVADVNQDPDVNPGVIEKGIKSFVGFPLKVGDHTIGALFLDSTVPQYFEEREIKLITMLVSQAAVTMEVARTFEDTEKQANLSTEMVRVSQGLTQARAINKQLDIIERFLRDVIAAPMFFLALYNEIGDTLDLKIIHENGQSLEQFSKQLSDKEEWGLTGYVVKSGKAFYWSSAQEQATQVERIGVQPDVRGRQSESGLILPLEASGAVVGALSVQSELPHAWSKSTQRIIQTLANLIAVALRNAQLFKEISDSQAHLHAALEASKEITTARDPDEALQAIVGRVRQVTGAWRAFCAIVDDIGTIRRPASVGFDENLVEAHSIRSNGISRSVLRSKRARFIQDTHKAKDDVHPKMIEQGVKSAACLPMIYEDQVIGLLWTHYQNFHSFSEGEQEALRLYAMQAAIAFMNALQMRKLEHMRQAVETLSGAVGTQDVLHQIVQSARDVLHANSAAIWSYDDVSDKFIPEDCVAAGIPEDIWETFRREEPRTGQTAYTVIQRSWVGVQNVNETKTYPFLGASTRRLLKKLGVNSFQGVALLDGDEILGILYVNYNQLRSFSKDEQETAKTFANHAALALKKAKLLDQLEAARNAARVVAHVSAVGELHSTLDSIVEGTLEALGCDAVTLYTFDDEKNEFGFPPSIAGVKDEETVFSYGFVSRESILYRIIDTNKMYFSDDSQNDPILSGPFTRREKIISTAGVPLISRGRKVGMMFVNYRKRHRFTHDETTNIELFANQAAVAIHNAYLYDQEKRLAAALRALHNAGRAVSSTLNLDQILGHIAEHAYHLALPKGESTHFSYLSWVEDGKMQFKASYPRSRVNALKEALGDIDLEHDKRIGISGRVATSGHSMLVGNATRHSAITLLEDGIHSQLSVPISIDDQVVGVISVVDMANDAFDEEDMRALEALADQACLAIRNAHQYEEIKETRGLVGARTALAWMGMASSVWGHAIRINAQTIREQLSLLKGDLKAMKVDNSAFRERLSTIDHLAQNIQEKPLTTPLSVEEGTEAVNLNGLITERTRQLWRNDPYRIASLELKLKLNDDATVIVNREWLRRAFDVLVDNAVSAVEHCATKEITIGTDETNVGYCEMFIKDTGQGIPEHIQDKILKDPIEKPERDQGMGLLIAQTIVQTYGGEIKMKYTGGEGTCMMIRLPLES